MLPVLFVLSLLAIGVSGDFPSNDDWQYASIVESWWNQGNYEGMKGKFAPIVMAQAAYAYVWVWMSGGFSFEVLRYSTLFLTAVTLVLVWFMTMRRTGHTSIANVIVLWWLFMPLFLVLSFSFMTDVPFTCIVVGFMAYLQRWHLKGRPKHGYVYLVLFSTAVFYVRQPGILLLLALMGALMWESLRWKTRMPFFTLFGLATTSVLIFLSWSWWQQAAALTPHYVSVDALFLQSMLTQPLDFVVEQGRRALKSTIYIGLFTLPLAPFLWAAFRQNGLFQKNWILGLSIVTVAITGFTMLQGKTFPFGGNVLYNLGLGPELLFDTYTAELSSPFHVPQWIMLLLQCLGTLHVLYLGMLIWKCRFEKMDIWMRVAIVFGLLYLMAMSTTSFFDRYLIPIVLLVGVGLSPKFTMPRSALSLLPTAFFGIFSVVATHDYQSWQNAHAQLLYEYTEKGGDYSAIDAGYAWNGWWQWSPDIPKKPATSFWWVMDDTYKITFQSLPGHTVQSTVEWSNWRSLETRKLYLLYRDLPKGE